jgi:hypothetical protein
MRFQSSVIGCLGLLLALTSCSSPRVSSSAPSPTALTADRAITEQLSRVGIVGCQRVRAYTINSGDKHPSPNQGGIIDGRLNPKRLPKDGVELSSAQIAHFLRATATTEHPGPHAYCFYPHHALVFFGADDKIIGHYTICFMCLGYDNSVGRFVSEPDYKDLHRLIASIPLPKP